MYFCLDTSSNYSEVERPSASVLVRFQVSLFVSSPSAWRLLVFCWKEQRFCPSFLLLSVSPVFRPPLPPCSLSLPLPIPSATKTCRDLPGAPHAEQSASSGLLTAARWSTVIPPKLSCVTCGFLPLDVQPSFWVKAS